MALVKCGECGKDISSSAEMCPHCGKKQPKAKAKTSLITWVIGGLLLLVFVRCSMTSTSAPADTRTPEQIAKAKAADAADTNRMVKSEQVLRSIKAAMRDPDSVKWTMIRANDDATVVCVEYRARNGFGGMNVEYATYSGGAISTKPAAWNKHCTKGLFDMSKAANYVK